MDKLIENLKELAKDESNHVKLSLTEAIFKICKFCSVEKALEGMLEIIKILLKDSDTQVRLKLLQGLQIFNNHIGKDNTSTHVIPLI